jgi:uracil-DNA glycosylase
MRLEESWLSQLSADLEQPYMQHLRQFLAAEKRAGKRIFPRDSEIFSAFSSTPLDTVKVVILGQDPYHGEGQAHGLCFSVKPGVKVPPSLLNIYKELHANLGIAISDHGNLESWAKQGVLLLNSVLSVECGLAASHQGKGWEQFTDRVIEVINHRLSGVVFMLWGNYAHRKGAMVDRTKHCVLQAPHPSPLSAYRGFFGCDHFSTANDYLRLRGTSPIDWGLKQVQLA